MAGGFPEGLVEQRSISTRILVCRPTAATSVETDEGELSSSGKPEERSRGREGMVQGRERARAALLYRQGQGDGHGHVDASMPPAGVVAPVFAQELMGRIGTTPV